MIKKIVFKKASQVEKTKTKKSTHVTKLNGEFVTPILTIWKTTVVNPYIYKNGQSRYGIVAVLDKENIEDCKFLSELEALAVENEVRNLGTQGKDGRIYIKFASRDKPDVMMLDPKTDKEHEIELDEEFPTEIKGRITYDVNLYFNTKLESWMFNLCVRKFVFCPDKKSKKLMEVIDEKGKSNSENTRGRPRAKNNRLRKN